jgi:SsrA-binding protein
MKVIATNRRARHDYQIDHTLVVGLVLTGAEVKSAKLGSISLKGSFVRHKNGELYLMNAHISPYKFAPIEDNDPARERKLLAHRKQIEELIEQSSAQGMTAIPLKVGLERGLVKLEIGVGRGKKLHDKRESLRYTATKRDIERDIKNK